MKKKSSAIKGRSGFTLIEMITTVAIIGIMAAVAIPAFSQWIPGYKLKSASRDVFSNIQLAKLEAIKRGGDCEVTMDTVDNIYSISVASDGTIIKTVTLADYGSGITFDPSYVTDDTITFTPRGMATFSSSLNEGYAYLTNDQASAHYRVKISSVGSLSFEKLIGGTWK